VFGNTVVKTASGSISSNPISDDAMQFDKEGNLNESSLLELMMNNGD